MVCGRRLEPLEETARAAEGGRVEARACDIREEEQVDALVDGVIERHGQIDLLVNNAGGQYLTPAEDITPKGFRTVIRLNVEGTWLMTHAVATQGDDSGLARRQDRERDALASSRPARDGALLGGARRRREPDPGAVDRVGALRRPAHGGGARAVRHGDDA